MLSRGPGELQIGVDQEPSLVLAGVHPDLKEVLALLDGRHSLVDVEGAAARLGISRSHLAWCLRTLHEAGLVVNRAGHDDDIGAQRRVRLVGAGRLGSAVARLLAQSNLSQFWVADDQPPDRSLYPASGPAGTQAEALVAALTQCSTTRLRVLSHWSKPEDSPPDLTIVASDLLECDRVVATGLLRADQPHLIVRGGGGGVVVGPFVVPGRTACLHCTDLARRDADPAWPMLLSQLARTRATLPAVSVAWAGGVAVAQALAFLRGASPETYGATIELSATDYLTRWRSWSMHPSCGCAWEVPAADRR